MLTHALVKTTPRVQERVRWTEAAEAAHDGDVHEELDEAFGREGHPLQVGAACHTHTCDCCGSRFVLACSVRISAQTVSQAQPQQMANKAQL